jgi:hypothetical protein
MARASRVERSGWASSATSEAESGREDRPPGGLHVEPAPRLRRSHGDAIAWQNHEAGIDGWVVDGTAEAPEERVGPRATERQLRPAVARQLKHLRDPPAGKPPAGRPERQANRTGDRGANLLERGLELLSLDLRLADLHGKRLRVPIERDE